MLYEKCYFIITTIIWIRKETSLFSDPPGPDLCRAFMFGVWRPFALFLIFKADLRRDWRTLCVKLMTTDSAVAWWVYMKESIIQSLINENISFQILLWGCWALLVRTEDGDHTFYWAALGHDGRSERSFSQSRKNQSWGLEGKQIISGQISH